MPGLAMDARNGESGVVELNNGVSTAYKDSFVEERSPRSALSPKSQHGLAIDGEMEASIEQLYHNVYEMQSSEQSPSMSSYGSYIDESRINSELRHLVRDFGVVETTEEVVAEKNETEGVCDLASKKQRNTEASAKSSPKSKSSQEKNPFEKERNARKVVNAASPLGKQRNSLVDGSENPDLGPVLLKQTRDMMSSGENPKKALELALRATKSFEKCTDGKPSLDLVMSFHVLAALYSNLGQYNEAIPVLERSIEIPFDEAEKLCQIALDIHGENGAPASIEEAADRKLMGLICDSKGDYESALEHYVLASMAMAANGNEVDVASIDCSIGDAYLSLARYDEAVLAYQKALSIGKVRDSRTYCEDALRIYGKPNPGIPSEEIASGLIDIAAIYQSMHDLDQALKLLKKALTIFGEAPGQQSTIAGIEAQMGVMYYMMASYTDSYNTFKSSISKFRASGEKKSALFGIALNQMGLACIQRYSINEATDLFEEARNILEKEYGPYHPDTLGVYSNLAGTYDAMGRLNDAIEILDYVVDIREEKLGTANPDVIDEKRRLGELLKEAGRVRSRKPRSLVTLLTPALR
ncbi:hypothetical protein GOBAR_DD31203 [Gossypium barbadense]|nr:hypothetical protein GOBAR_DD31203 [Gossypium barbadense]